LKKEGSRSAVEVQRLEVEGGEEDILQRDGGTTHSGLGVARVNTALVTAFAVTVQPAKIGTSGWARPGALARLEQGHVRALGIAFTAVYLSLVVPAEVEASADIESEATEGWVDVGHHAQLCRSYSCLET